MNMYIHHNLRYLRESKGLTLAQVSEDLDVKTSSLSGYEKGDYFPKLPLIIRFSQYYDVYIDDLVKKDLSKAPGRPASSPPKTAEEKVALQARVIDLLETRVRELEREILRKDPGLARELGIE